MEAQAEAERGERKRTAAEMKNLFAMSEPGVTPAPGSAQGRVRVPERHPGVWAALNGFISHEYERLDRRFRFPKLCTVAGMRRRYPGHKSYGLGKLCDLYGIELETHHRALCDARATGHLLNLMNLKREGCAPDRAEEAA